MFPCQNIYGKSKIHSMFVFSFWLCIGDIEYFSGKGSSSRLYNFSSFIILSSDVSDNSSDQPKNIESFCLFVWLMPFRSSEATSTGYFVRLSWENLDSTMNKCYDGSMEVELSGLLGSYERPTFQPTIGRTQGVIGKLHFKKGKSMVADCRFIYISSEFVQFLPVI